MLVFLMGFLKWKFAGKIVRKLLLMLAAWMVSKGWIAADQSGQLVGFAVGAISLLWSGAVEAQALKAASGGARKK